MGRFRKTVDHFLSYFSAIGKKFRSNVMAFVGLVDALTFPPCFAILFWSTDILVRAFCGLIILIMIWLNFREYDYWRTKDPDRLHSEKAWLDKLRMDYEIGGKGGTPRLPGKDDENQPRGLLQ